MDFNSSLRKAIRTGDVVLGQNSVKEMVREGKAQLVIMAQNCPAPFRQFIEGIVDLSVYRYEGSGAELGRACGKPFVVSALAIANPGDSDILSLKRS
ncbi:MAG: 50S ribosomal protein L30e [Methanomicrobiales archaeon]|nr:50S ribosomal protein L30e [Methanomicrobiales archaeon]